MTNLEVSFSILGFIVASLSAYYTYKAYKKPTNNISKTTQFTLGGDSVTGDKVGGYKVGGDKIVYTVKKDK